MHQFENSSFVYMFAQHTCKIWWGYHYYRADALDNYLHGLIHVVLYPTILKLHKKLFYSHQVKISIKGIVPVSMPYCSKPNSIGGVMSSGWKVSASHANCSTVSKRMACRSKVIHTSATRTLYKIIYSSATSNFKNWNLQPVTEPNGIH